MEKVISVTYASSLTKLCEVNSSFDSGVLRVAYPGVNRNGSSISKEAFERNIKTMYNCPIVCNYDREEGTLGGHDMDVVRDCDGELRLINVTTPVGVIPESAKYWWDFVEESDGTEHEYLFVEALLWKRQEAYKKIKQDGITAHSMEITVKDGEMVDGIYCIRDFEFTAFALIGVEPCFESSALELFSKQDFKRQLSEMMQDIKDSFTMISSTSVVGDDTEKPTEGGEKVLNEKMELGVTDEIEEETADFARTDLSAKAKAPKVESVDEQIEAPAEEPHDEPHEEVSVEGFEAAPEIAEETEEIVAEHGAREDKFALVGNIISEAMRAIESVTVQREWGECSRYWYIDCDLEKNEVYCYDVMDWLMYGFAFELDGDNVIVDFDSKKRVKYVIVDFDEGEQASQIARVFGMMEEKLHDNAELEAKYQTASEKIAQMEDELVGLKQFKADIEIAAEREKKCAVFAQFESKLAGNEMFESLKSSIDELTEDAIEEKCYAILGRAGVSAKFAAEEKAPKLPIAKREEAMNDPYGGVVEKYTANKH